MWIVRIALNRPYTFIVLALLILILSPVVIFRTPTDIFPNINIPVIAVSWTYTGLSPEETEGRITTVYERVLTTTVDNIEHIESTTVNGTAIVKVYLQPNASIDRANAQVTAVSQTILRQLPPGALPPLILNYSASTVPILQLGLSGKNLTESQLNDIAIELPAHPTGDGSGCVRSVSLRRKAAPGHGQFQPGLAAGQGALAQRCAHCAGNTKLDFARRHGQDRPI